MDKEKLFLFKRVMMLKHLTGSETEIGTDTEPYLFRASPSLGDYNAEHDEIVGASVAWNQLVLDINRNFTSAVSDTRPFTLQLRMFASPYTTAFVSNLGLGKGIYTRLFVGIDTQGSGLYLTHNGSQTNIEIWRNTDQQLVVGHKYLFNVNVVNNDTTTVGGLVLEDMMLIDLTAMFGSTIADYIYSLEQGTAGAGVAFFKKLFNKPYYAYNAGQLMSVKALRHITRGFNAWDEEWELGYYNLSTGEPVAGSANIRSKNYIRVIPDTIYHVKNPTGSYMVVAYYDADKNFIRNDQGMVNQNITTPSNCQYIRFHMTSAYGTTYNHDVCINLSWDGERDGEYEEYSEHIYELDSDLELRGIPKLSAGNDLYYDGDVYEPDGTVTRKYGIVDLGTLNWTDQSAGGNYSYYTDVKSDAKKPTSPNDVPNCVCANYVTTNSNSFVPDKPDKSITISTSGRINVKDNSYTTVEAFKSAMNGVMLVYELATPTTETATPYAKTQKVSPSGTEEYVSTSIVPVGHNTTYVEK